MRYVIAFLLLFVAAPVAAQEYVSTAGQTMDQFVMSIRKAVSAESRAAGVELCGPIRQEGDRFAVTLVKGERFSCEFTRTATDTGHSLHTHPYEAAAGFSEGDYQSGAGYMIWRGFVRHQQGAGTDRRVL